MEVPHKNQKNKVEVAFAKSKHAFLWKKKNGIFELICNDSHQGWSHTYSYSLYFQVYGKTTVPK